MELGFNTLGGLVPNRVTGGDTSASDRIKSIVAQGILAEELGFSAFSVGEHHGDLTFVTSAPPVILAAIASRTERIRLMTGVTLLPLLDPVRVAEDYATLDNISGGRVDIVAGKGNFPNAARLLIGEDNPDRNRLLRERLDLLLTILRDGHVPAWDGGFRPPLTDANIMPRPVQQPLPIYLGATRNLESIELAAEKGLPALIAGFRPGSYRDFAERYRERFAANGHDLARARVASLSVVAVSHDVEKLRREYREHWESMIRAASARNTSGVRVAAQDFDDLTGPNGQILLGTPEYVAERLIAIHSELGHELHLLQVDNGLSHDEVAENMELIASEVAPIVRSETSRAPANA